MDASPPPAPDRDHLALASFLADRDHPCPLCAYNLRDLKSGACPECGHRLALRVSLAEPRQGPFIAGLIGTAFGLGFCAFLLVWVVVMYLQSSGGPRREHLYPLFAGTAVGSLILWQWLRSRRVLMRIDTRSQWLCAVGAAGISFLCPFWFMLTVR
jgi:hypothetical protein